jgi:DNA polymerase-3 subunit gamma/tau
MSISLYRKYRPQNFTDVIGQQHIVQTLSNAIKHDRIGHAYLFTGPRGTGKTTMARIFAKAINCTNSKDGNPCLECDNCKNIGEGKSLDVFEIDAASNTGVENIRELRENVKFPPSQAKYKVYIIDEVHMLSSGAFNALLKTLEEPPAHVIFILATTEIHKVPETIISRCQRFDFTRLSLEHIIEKLSLVAKREKVEVEKSALEMIAISAEGGMRDAESLFSQVLALEDKNITSKEVEEILGTTKRQHIEQMVEYVLQKDLSGAIAMVDQLSQDGYDLEVFHKALLNYLRQVMLLCVDEKLVKTFSFELTKEQAEIVKKQAKGHTPSEMVTIISCFTEIQGKIKSAFIPQLPLELALVNAIKGKTAQIAAPQNAPSRPNPQPVTYQPQEPVRPQETPKIGPEVKPSTQVQPQTAAAEAPKIATAAPQPAPEAKPAFDASTLKNGSFTLSEIQKIWNTFTKTAIQENQAFGTLFPSCKPIAVDGSTIIIATKFGFYRDMVMEQNNRLTLETTFAKILGSKAIIKAITEEESGMKVFEARPVINPAEPKQEKPSETSSLLADAMGMMGGQIVE